jgi:hypothetical protein
MNTLDNNIAQATQAEKNEKKQKKLNEYLNFFTTQKKTPRFIKKSLLSLLGAFIISQSLFAINEYQHFTNYEDVIDRESIMLNMNYHELQKNIENNNEQGIVLNYLKGMQQQTYMSNLLIAEFTLDIVKNDKVSEKTRQMIFQIWQQNEFTGVNQEYQNFKQLNACMAIDLPCKLVNHVVDLDAYDLIIRQRLAHKIYRINHIDEYKQLMKQMNPMDFEKSEFYQKENEYVKENALLSRPDENAWKKVMQSIMDGNKDN